MKDRVLLGCFVLVLLLFAVLLVRKLYLTQPPAQPVATGAPSVTVDRREVLLYFPPPDMPYLVGETREIEDCRVDDDCLQSTVQALIEGPVGALAPVLPPQAALHRVTVEGDLVVLDFNRDFVSRHPGGSMSELLTVYSLVDTLAVNFPYVRQLRILVDGEPLETIKGHVDLRAPLIADFKYTRTPETSEGVPLPLGEEPIEEEPSDAASTEFDASR